jgi:hypothetical protein
MRRQRQSDDEADMAKDEVMIATQDEDMSKERIKEEKRKIRQQYRELITDTEGKASSFICPGLFFAAVQACSPI